MSPRYTTDVPADPRGPSFPILRTPAYKPLIAIVTSEDLIGTFTHYFHGRTTPCDGDGCPACHDGLPYRWHAYQSAYNPENAMHFIFECTAQAAETFVQYRENGITLRGCKFQAIRLGGKPNGRVMIKTMTADLTQIALPKPPDLTKALAILWNLPDTDVEVRGRDAQNRTGRVRHQPKSGQTPGA